MLYDRSLQSNHNPIIIESNTDFETQGWSGNGSINNPYRIEDLEIVIFAASQSCIVIQNVSSYFLIQNCSFSYDDEIEFEQRQRGYGVRLNEVSNGRIINCIFTHLERGIYTYNSSKCTTANCSFTYSHVGIDLMYSSEWIIANNSFIHCSNGLDFDFVNNTVVTDNTVLFNEIGIDLSTTSECNLTSNLIAYNTEVGMAIWPGCSINNIFNNSIAFNQDESIHVDMNAQDDGYDNFWDDNISIGNEWGDYSGTGVYAISGSAGSVDRFPSVADFDLAGPTLYSLTDYRVTAAPITTPFTSVHYHASAYDQSGVDTVLLYLSNASNGIWSYVEMEYQPSTLYSYSYSFEGPLYSLDFIRYYYFWANDTLGHESVSGMYGTWLYCSILNGSSSNDSSNNVAIIMSVGGVAIVLTLIILRLRSRNEEWPRIGYG